VPAAVHELVARIYGRRPGAPGSSWERSISNAQYAWYRSFRKLFDQGRRATRGAATVEETLRILKRQKIGDKLRVESKAGRSSNPAQGFLARFLFRFPGLSAKELAALTILHYRRRSDAERKGKKPVPVTEEDADEAVFLVDRLRPRNRKTEITTPS
jgi:hypothetical protein